MGIKIMSDCFIAELILKAVFDIEPARSKTISTSSGINGKGSFKSRFKKFSSGKKLS